MQPGLPVAEPQGQADPACASQEQLGTGGGTTLTLASLLRSTSLLASSGRAPGLGLGQLGQPVAPPTSPTQEELK